MTLFCVLVGAGQFTRAEESLKIWDPTWAELETAWTVEFDQLLGAILNDNTVAARAKVSSLTVLLAKLNTAAQAANKVSPRETTRAVQRIIVDASARVAGRRDFFEKGDKRVLAVYAAELAERTADLNVLKSALSKRWWSEFRSAFNTRAFAGGVAAGLSGGGLATFFSYWHFHSQTFQTPTTASVAIATGLVTAWNWRAPFPRWMNGRENLVAAAFDECRQRLTN